MLNLIPSTDADKILRNIDLVVQENFGKNENKGNYKAL